MTYSLPQEKEGSTDVDKLDNEDINPSTDDVEGSEDEDSKLALKKSRSDSE